MKKLLKCLLMIMLLITFISCNEEKEKIKVLLPSGTPFLAVGNLIDDEDFEFDVVNGQDKLMEGFTDGEYDLIIAPLNLGTKVYLNGKSSYKLESIITTNNTYITSKEEIKDIEDIKDKKILAFGQGSTPSLALNAVLDYKNIEATIDYRSSASDVSLEFMSQNTEYDYFVLAEPNITTLEEKTQKTIYKISLSEVLKEEVSYLIQACLFVNSTKDISNKIINKIEKNIKNMNENPEKYASNIESKDNFFSGLTKEVIAKAIPNCNIVYLKASENKDIIQSYYNLLNKYQPKVLDGKTPSEDFYR